MVWLDRVLAILFILGGVAHSFGSFVAFKNNELELLWALSASLFVFLLGALNLLRTWKPGDGALAWICLTGGLCWIVASMRFASLMGSYLEPRALIFAFLSLGLCVFSVRSLMVARR